MAGAVVLAALTGCRQTPEPQALSLPYSYWYDHLERPPIDLSQSEIVERRFFNHGDMLLGRHEFKREPGGPTYGNEYRADLTWESLRARSAEHKHDYWVISHLSCGLTIHPYRVDEDGRRIPAGSVAYRELSVSTPGAWSYQPEPAPGHNEVGWDLYLEVFSAAGPQPTYYVNPRYSSRAALQRFTQEAQHYHGVSFVAEGWSVYDVRNSSNGLAYAWAGDVVRSDLIVEVRPTGEVVVYNILPEKPAMSLAPHNALDAAFHPGQGVLLGEVEVITASNGTDPFNPE